MNRNCLSKITISSLALFLALLTFGCQTDQSVSKSFQQEDEMQENESQAASGNTTVSIDNITNTTWQWTELTEKDPAAQSVVPDPENYTLTFKDDGSFSFKADCNSGSGTYAVDGKQIGFGPMMSTLAMCPSELLHDTFLSLLGEIDTFGMADDKLVLTLKKDGGEMRFANGGPVEKPQTPTEELKSRHQK